MTIKTSLDGRGNRIMKFTLKALAVAAVASASTFTFADEPTSPHSVSANIGLSSAYVLRGNTAGLENDGATVTGGIDYEHASGFYAGYWGSTLGYSLKSKGTGKYIPVYLDGSDEPEYEEVIEEGNNSFENDFYLGYNGSITEDLGYSVGAVYYYYYEADNTDVNGFELTLGLNYKDFGVTTNTLLQDTTWGNAGDTYIAGSYSYGLPYDFSLNSTLGLYYYSDSGDYEGNEDYWGKTTKDFSFRHLTLGLSKDIGETGASAAMDYVIGGELRDGSSLKNKVVFSLSYGF